MDKSRRKNDEEVEVTWDLLKKERDNPNDLTENEKKALLEYYQVLKKRDREETEARNQLEKDCKYLTSGAEKCLIPAYGWIRPIKEMAYELEALNIFLRRFHSVITFDQIKEKFGTFRGYYSINPTNHLLYKILTWPFHTLRWLLENKVKYCQTRIELEPRHDVEQYVELKPDEPEDSLDGAGIVEISGKKYRKKIFSCTSKTKIVPQRFRLLWKAKDLVRWLDMKFSSLVSFTNRESRADVVVREALDDKVQKIVDECERKCNDHCIRCGRWIGSGSRRFQTKGWITYICSECAKLEPGAVDCSASSTIRSQLAFERRLKKAITECGIDKAVVNGSPSSLDEAVKKLGDMKSVKDGVRELVVGKYDDEELYSEEDDDIEYEF